MDLELKLTFVVIAVMVVCVLIVNFQGRTKKSNKPVLRDSQKPDPLVLMEEYNKRVKELFSRLSVSRVTYVGFFNEKQELSGDDFMYVLMDARAEEFRWWFIYYPNPKYNIFMMIFDRQLPWDAVMKDIEFIDDFYGSEGKLYDTADNYPSYVWGSGNYDPDITRKDVGEAAEIDPIFKDFLEQFL